MPSAPYGSIRLHARAGAGRRLVGGAGVAHAIGQALDLRVAAETEVRAARLVDRPAATGRAELEQGAAASVADRLGCHRGRGRQPHEDPMLAEEPRDIVALWPPGAALPLRRGCSQAPGARDAEAVHLADDRIAGHPDLAGDLAASEAGTDAAPKLRDPFRGPGCPGAVRFSRDCLMRGCLGGFGRLIDAAITFAATQRRMRVHRARFLVRARGCG